MSEKTTSNDSVPKLLDVSDRNHFFNIDGSCAIITAMEIFCRIPEFREKSNWIGKMLTNMYEDINYKHQDKKQRTHTMYNLRPYIKQRIISVKCYTDKIREKMNAPKTGGFTGSQIFEWFFDVLNIGTTRYFKKGWLFEGSFDSRVKDSNKKYVHLLYNGCFSIKQIIQKQYDDADVLQFPKFMYFHIWRCKPNYLFLHHTIEEVFYYKEWKFSLLGAVCTYGDIEKHAVVWLKEENGVWKYIDNSSEYVINYQFYDKTQFETFLEVHPLYRIERG